MESNEKAKTVDLAIIGLAKDCERTLPLYFSLLHSLEAGGLTYYSIVGENGSTDKTKELLTAEAQAGFLHVEDTDFLSSIPERLERMARGREHLKEALIDMSIIPRFVCVVDLDNIMEIPPTVQDMKDALQVLESQPDAFGVSATSQPHYYDLLAYERDDLSFENLTQKISTAKLNPFNYYKFFVNTIFPAQQALTKNSEMTCVSAFNGMAIYRFSDYRTGSYISDQIQSISEHIPFNRSLAKSTGKYMIISPCISFKTPDDHIRRGFFCFWWQRLQKSVPKF